MKNDNPLYGWLLRIFFLTVLINSSITVMSQGNIRSAFNKYKKGNTQKALQILQFTKEENKQIHYHYVYALCLLEFADKSEDYLNIKKAVENANPKHIQDTKLQKKLETVYSLTLSSYNKLLDTFYIQTFNHYNNLNTWQDWQEHNIRYPHSTQFGEAFNMEARSSLNEILMNQQNDQFAYIYGLYQSTALSNEIYNAWAEYEFSIVIESRSSESLLVFYHKFNQSPLAQKAFKLARELDYQYAITNIEIDILAHWVTTYNEIEIEDLDDVGPKFRRIYLSLDSLYHDLLVYQEFDIEVYQDMLYMNPDVCDLQPDLCISQNLRNEIDSVFYLSLYKDLLKGRHDKVSQLYQRNPQRPDAFGFELINRMVQNLETTYIPFFNGIGNWNIGRIDRKPSEGSMISFKAEWIERDGDRFYTFRKENKFGAIYINDNNDYEILGGQMFAELVSVYSNTTLIGYLANDSKENYRLFLSLEGDIIKIDDFDYLDSSLGNKQHNMVLQFEPPDYQEVNYDFKYLIPWGNRLISPHDDEYLLWLNGLVWDNIYLISNRNTKRTVLYNLKGDELLIVDSTSIKEQRNPVTINTMELMRDDQYMIITSDTIVESLPIPNLNYFQNQENYITFTKLKWPQKYVRGRKFYLDEYGKIQIVRNDSIIYSTSTMALDLKYFFIYSSKPNEYNIVTKVPSLPLKIYDSIEAILSYNDSTIIYQERGGRIQLLTMREETGIFESTIHQKQLITLEEYFYVEEEEEEYDDDYYDDEYEEYDDYDDEYEGYDDDYCHVYLEIDVCGLDGGNYPNYRQRNSWPTKLDLMPLLINSSIHFFNHLGELIVNFPSQDCTVAGWTIISGGKIYDRNGEFICNHDGGYLNWIDQFSFEYSTSNGQNYYRSSTQDANGAHGKISDGWPIVEFIGPNIAGIHLQCKSIYYDMATGTPFGEGYKSDEFMFYRLCMDYKDQLSESQQYNYYKNAINQLMLYEIHTLTLELHRLDILMTDCIEIPQRNEEITNQYLQLCQRSDFSSHHKKTLLKLINYFFSDKNDYVTSMYYIEKLEVLLSDALGVNFRLSANKPDIALKKAYCYYQTGEYREAIECYTEIDENYYTLCQRGHCYFKLSDYESSLSFFQKALSKAQTSEQEYLLADGIIYINLFAAAYNGGNTELSCEYLKLGLPSENADVLKRYKKYCIDN